MTCSRITYWIDRSVESILDKALDIRDKNSRSLWHDIL